MSSLPRLLIVRLVLIGMMFAGLAVLALSAFGWAPSEVRPWVLVGILLGGIGLDLLGSLETYQTPTRPTIGRLIASLGAPLLCTVIGVLWFGYPLAMVALALGLGSGAAVITLWVAARSKATLTDR